MSSSIALNLAHAGTTDSEKVITDTLEALVNGTVEPTPAAKTIDRIIVDQVGKGDGYPAGWRQYLWLLLGNAVPKIPHEHPGQDRLVSMLQAIQNLSPHSLPYTDEEGQRKESQLWDTTPKGYSDLEQWLWEVNEGEYMLPYQCPPPRYSSFPLFYSLSSCDPVYTPLASQALLTHT